jgi:dTDP-4-dehydrorhamnose reductase
VCEERPRWASRINEGGAQAVADVFADSCSITYLSTDLVFSGIHPPEKGYTEEAAPDPVNVAGRTFTEAENILKSVHRSCVIRLGLPIGRSITGTKGAVDWVESRLKKGFPVTLFHDEYRSCISCESIAAMTLRMLLIEAEGLFHLGGPEPKSLHEIGTMVARSGNYPQHLLNSISRLEEKNGPPRIGNVALNSEKISRVSGIAVGSI